MTERSTLEVVATILADALEPLTGALTSPKAAENLLAQLGWSLPPGVDDLQLTVSSLPDMIDKLVVLVGTTDDERDDLVLIAGRIAELSLAVGDVVADLIAAAGALQGLPGVTAEYLARTGLPEELVTRLVDYLVVSYLRTRQYLVFALLQLAGVVEVRDLPADPANFQTAHQRLTLRWDRFATVVSNEQSWAAAVYGWGTSSADLGRLLAHFGEALLALGAGVLPGTVPRAVEEELLQRPMPEAESEPMPRLVVPVLQGIGDPLMVGVALMALRPSTSGAADAGLGLSPFAFGTIQAEFPLARPDALAVTVESSVQLDGGIALLWRPGTPILVRSGMFGTGQSLTAGRIALGLRWLRPDQSRQPLVVLPGGLELSAAQIRTAVGGEIGPEGPDAFVALSVVDARIVLDTTAADSFLKSALPAEALELAFALDVLFSQRHGLRIDGGAGLQATFALTLDLGPIRIERLDVSVLVDGAQIVIAGRISGAISVGPVAAAVEGIGVGAVLAFQQGNLGPLDLSFRFLPPRGLGLSINAGPVAGGGFIALDEVTGRYFGVLAVRVGPVSVTAIGMLDTRLPSGERGYSLLIVLAARFPGIQLGFGIMLTGVGGLVGVNRRFDTDALRERFSSGTVGRILAPENPVRDAPTLLGELSAVFPPAPGVFVVGPTLQLTWVDVVKADLGIFIELPGPTKIVLLGVVRAVLENPSADGPLLQLRCDILGVLDFPAATLSFDAVLVDSTLLEVFILTGGMAFRLNWGAEPYVLLSIGGFHPAFSPAPLMLPPSLTRMAMSYSFADVGLSLRLEGYFAITPNTVQLGARIEALIEFGPLSALGFLSFDVLIRFQPFAFQFDFEARMEVRWKGRRLAGVRVKGSLSGPGPVVFTGELCIEILFFSICASATFELGSQAPPVVTPVASALDELAAELRDPVNLGATGSDPLVLLGPPPPDLTLPVVPPTGELVWRQRRAPLRLLLQRFDSAPLTRHETVTAASAQLVGEEHDWFAPGSFAELSDAEAVNRRSFERMPGGIRLGAGADTTSDAVDHEVTVQEFRLPEPQPATVDAFAPPDWLLRAGDLRLGLGGGDRPTPHIGVAAEPWEVYGADGQVLASTDTSSQAHQLAEAMGGGAAAVPAGDVVTLGSL